MKLTFRLIALIILFFMSCIQYTPAQSWSKLGGGSLAAKDGIGSVCRDAAGNIYAGGSFTNGINSAAGKHYVAKWDITTNTWSELGGLNALSANNFILSVNADLIGNIYAAGRFTNSNGERYVAKWDKTTNTWSELGGLNSLAANSDILSVCSDAAGNIYAAGWFTNSSGQTYVAKWDINTNTWSELGGLNSLAVNVGIESVCSDAAGNIYAAGGFAHSNLKRYVAKWDKTTNTWSELGGLNSLAANSNIFSVCRDAAGNIYAAGYFTNSSGKRYVAKWDITTNTWSELGGLNALSANNFILSVNADLIGNIYAAGRFANSNGKRYVAKWDITTNTWSELGGLNSLAANNDILSVCSDTAGNIYAAGSFTDSIVSNNLSGVYYVAKYSGTLYVRTICPGDSFLFFNHYYSVAGNYYDTLINYLGGDSVITLHLTVKQTAFASDTAVLCYLHTYNFYGQMLSQSGNYVDTLKSYLGCDSLIHTLHLTILPANTDTLKASICYGQSYLFGHDTLYQSGFYYDTLSGAALGCDSIIVLQLTILPKLIDTIQQQFCKGNTYIFNHDTLSQAGLYTDTLTSYRGCDSIIVLQLQIHSADTVHLQQQICYGGSYLFNQHVLLVSGVYSAVLTNQYGCDSLLLLNLTVLPAIDTSLSFTNDTLFSNATACTYQWFNCDSNKINVGATNSSFKPTLAGHYAVILTSTNNANCVDTSNCRMVRLNTGISSFTINNSQLTIYPNPCGNKLSISGMQLSGNTKIEVLDVLGQVVFNKSINNSTNQPIQLDVSNFTSQIYLLKVTDATGEQYFAKFVKQ